MADVKAGSDGLYGTYWKGSNGHIYFSPNGGGGVIDEGIGDAGKNMFRTSYGGVTNVVKARQVADPNAPKPAQTQSTQTIAPDNPNGGGSSSGGASLYEDKSNDIAQQNAGLAAVEGQRSSGLAAVDKAFNGIIGNYDEEAGRNEASYRTSSDTNQNNYQTRKQSALVNAASGLQGLRGTLASLGALNGSGIDLANKAVQAGANADLSGASDTFGDNQTTLDTGIATFRDADKRRRQDATTAAEDARTNVNNTVAKAQQGFYQNLSNDYAAQGDKAQSRAFADRAASLFGTIANTSLPSTNLAYTSAAYTPAALSSYITNNNGTAVSTAPTEGVPGAVLPNLYASTDLKKKQAAAAV